MCRLYNVIFVLSFIEITISQLRIRDGMDLPDKKGDKRYMVYLTKAPGTQILYDAWICGGAIVSKKYILTSAACVEDVVHMYAIAGYKKYVNENLLKENSCTNQYKKKIVEYCVPLKYEFSFPLIEKWARIDIALAKVETPYNLENDKADDGCTWPIRAIEISYFKRWQSPNIDAVVFGWGHNKSMRKPSDPFDYNSKELKYATAHIVPKEICKAAYSKVIANFTVFSEIIDSYMICTKGKGNFDYNGDMINKEVDEIKDGCSDLRTEKLRNDCMKRNGFDIGTPYFQTVYWGSKTQLVPGNPEANPKNTWNPELASYADFKINPGMPRNPEITGFRKNKPEYTKSSRLTQISDPIYPAILQKPINSHKLGYPQISPKYGYPKQQENQEISFNRDVAEVSVLRESDNIEFGDLTRRQESSIEEDLRVSGICQNDHGGPLVTWVGSKEYLIGVASVFLIHGKDAECIGPYLFTSTHCNSHFLKCKLQNETRSLRNVVEKYGDGRRQENSETFDLVAYCNKPDKEKGYRKIERKISWRDHPDGPSAVDIEEDKEKELQDKTERQNPYKSLNSDINGSGFPNVPMLNQNDKPINLQPNNNPNFRQILNDKNLFNLNYQNAHQIIEVNQNVNSFINTNESIPIIPIINNNNGNSSNNATVAITGTEHGDDESIEALVLRDLI